MDVFARETNKDISKLNEIDENDNDSVEGTVYILDVLWCQPIKLIQVVSTSEFHEY